MGEIKGAYLVGWFTLVREGDFTTVAGSFAHCCVCNRFAVRDIVVDDTASMTLAGKIGSGFWIFLAISINSRFSTIK